MSLSRRDHEDRSPIAIEFEPERMAEAIRVACPDVDFALLLGSARDGRVPPGGDVDLAVSTRGRLGFDGLGQIVRAAESVVPGVPVDVGCFDRAEPVYRFEALRGRLLFARDLDRYLDAFSRTCREYEDRMIHYRRQRRYRLERGSPVS